MKFFYLILCLIFSLIHSAEKNNEITPYKYTDKDRAKGLPSYIVPSASRFTTTRSNSLSNIVYYLSKPKNVYFPIAILCGGSSSKNDIGSIIHFHRYFLQDFLDLGSAVLTIEQQGIDGDNISITEFMENYTRSNRLQDHCDIIEHLKHNPPQGWNGKFIFLGVSEGGPIVTTLTTRYSDCTGATINWCGAAGWSWRDELWAFIEGMKKEIPWYIKFRMHLPKWMPFAINFYIPKTRKEYDAIMDKTLQDPDCNKEFMGMTYKYHADALTYPCYDYNKICTPMLIVAGDQDTIIHSSDEFVDKAKQAHAPVSYMRVVDMGHHIRKHPDVVEKSFEWLKQWLG